MSTHEVIEPIVTDGTIVEDAIVERAVEDTVLDDGWALADVIELPRADAPSFYQRNSGSLPKSTTGMSDAHRRAQLPRPDNTDPDTLFDKLRSLLRR